MKQHLLIVRFSALGDILMAVPVIDALARQYPELQITVVSRPFVGSIIQLLPNNVSFYSVDLKNYRGTRGLNQLCKELSKLNPTMLADFHNVLRTIYIRSKLRLKKIKTSHIHKDRKARRRFITSKVKVQQKTSFELYAQCLKELGFDVEIDWHQRFSLLKTETCEKLDAIGVAPFAAHKGKIFPLEKMEEVVANLSEHHKVFLFGAGNYEKQILDLWESKYSNVESVVDKLPNMAEELRLISQLQAMLTMDSGNMHLASLAGIPVISIWGATHPLGGFLAWGQSLQTVVQCDLPCRPCSIYGNKTCRYGDWHCLNDITNNTVIEKIEETILQNKN